MSVARLTAAIQQIALTAERARDEEAALRKIVQLCRFALDETPRADRFAAATNSIGAEILASAEQAIREQDVIEAAQEMADTQQAERLATHGSGQA